MSNKADQLKDLLLVTEVIKQKDFALLGELTEKRHELLREIEHLDEALAHGLRQQIEDAVPSVSLNSRQADWQMWHRQKKHSLLTALANLEAERELKKAKAKVSFGRSEAVQAMRDKLRPQAKSV